MSKVVRGEIVFEIDEVIEFIASRLKIPKIEVAESTLIPHSLQVAMAMQFGRSLIIDDVDNCRLKDLLSQLAQDAV